MNLIVMHHKIKKTILTNISLRFLEYWDNQVRSRYWSQPLPLSEFLRSWRKIHIAEPLGYLSCKALRDFPRRVTLQLTKRIQNIKNELQKYYRRKGCGGDGDCGVGGGSCWIIS